MRHNYTRQRQGRDFSITGYLRSAEMSTESNYNNINDVLGDNDPKDDTEKKKSIHEQMEQYKAEAERNSVPIDGHEPPLERGR